MDEGWNIALKFCPWYWAKDSSNENNMVQCHRLCYRILKKCQHQPVAPTFFRWHRCWKVIILKRDIIFKNFFCGALKKVYNFRLMHSKTRCIFQNLVPVPVAQVISKKQLGGTAHRAAGVCWHRTIINFKEY